MFQAAGKGQGTGVGVWELCTCSSPFGHSLQVPQTHCYWLKLYQGTRCCSPRLQISSNSWSGKQAANSWKVELLWLIWKRIRTEIAVCAAVLGRVVQQLHLFFSPPPPCLILAFVVSCDQRKELPWLHSSFVCCNNHFNNQEDKSQKSRSDHLRHL